MINQKEVCITTWFGTENYGSNLQAIGLEKTIQNLGYKVSFLRNFNVMPFQFRHPRLLLTKIINRINKRKSVEFFSRENYEITDKRKKRINDFNKRYFNTRSFRTSEQWNDAIKHKMIFACGSDIIWNPARGYPDFRFLDFAYYAGLNRFSYASSIGAMSLPRKYFSAYKRYLGSMKAVGVREQSVADMLAPIIGCPVEQVVDPTLLLTKEEWKEFSNSAELSIQIPAEGYVLCYFVMNDMRYWDYVKKIKDQTGLQIIVLPMHENDETQPYTILMDGTPYEFTWLIRNAELICTDSFHACVISMIFEKEFYLLRRERKSEDAKYDDFLGKYGLVDRSVSDETRFVRETKINYVKAKQLLEEDRNRSMKYLTRTLEACNG